MKQKKPWGGYLSALMCVLSVLLPLLANADDNQKCVPPDIAVNAWSDAVSRMDRPMGGLTTMTLECNPCKCPTNGMAACYEFMAQRERVKEQEYQKATGLLERAKKYGICR